MGGWDDGHHDCGMACKLTKERVAGVMFRCDTYSRIRQLIIDVSYFDVELNRAECGKR